MTRKSERSILVVGRLRIVRRLMTIPFLFSIFISCTKDKNAEIENAMQNYDKLIMSMDADAMWWFIVVVVSVHQFMLTFSRILIDGTRAYRQPYVEPRVGRKKRAETRDLGASMPLSP